MNENIKTFSLYFTIFTFISDYLPLYMPGNVTIKFNYALPLISLHLHQRNTHTYTYSSTITSNKLESSYGTQSAKKERKSRIICRTESSKTEERQRKRSQSHDKQDKGPAIIKINECKNKFSTFFFVCVLLFVRNGFFFLIKLFVFLAFETLASKYFDGTP